jgi:cytochrome c-type biogenesis protein CcmH/NrfF
MVREPSVEQIVDRILALNCGERCAITLNPRITHISNLEWLLPICVEQFGTRITIDQQAQGLNVVLMITATQSRKHVERERVVGEQPASIEVRERVVGELLVSVDGT